MSRFSRFGEPAPEPQWTKLRDFEERLQEAADEAYPDGEYKHPLTDQEDVEYQRICKRINTRRANTAKKADIAWLSRELPEIKTLESARVLLIRRLNGLEELTQLREWSLTNPLVKRFKVSQSDWPRFRSTFDRKVELLMETLKDTNKLIKFCQKEALDQELYIRAHLDTVHGTYGPQLEF